MNGILNLSFQSEAHFAIYFAIHDLSPAGYFSRLFIYVFMNNAYQLKFFKLFMLQIPGDFSVDNRYSCGN